MSTPAPPARPALAALAVTAFAALAGCAGGPPLQGPESAAGNDASASSAPFVTIERLPANGSIRADDLLPGHDGIERWRSIDGVLAPEGFEIATAPSSIVAGARATRTADLETAHWVRGPDGSVALDRVDSHPDRTTSLFEPALQLAPASLDAQVDLTATSSMRAVLTARPESERDRGTAHRTLRYDRDERVRWMGEEARVKVVEIAFTAELGSAKVTRTSQQWVLPGEGVIAERWHETLVILKLFTKESGQFAVRERR